MCVLSMPTLRPIGIKLSEEFTKKEYKRFYEEGPLRYSEDDMKRLAKEYNIKWSPKLAITGHGFYHFDRCAPVLEFCVIETGGY